MKLRELNRWDLTPKEAVVVQRELASMVSHTDVMNPADVRLVAGVDNGYLRAAAATTAVSAAVVLDARSLAVVETREAVVPVIFPYVPGLLAFRELPAMAQALAQLEAEPDVLLVDAHGYAHPRRLGAASHLGLLVDKPTIGCAKSRFVGTYDEPGPEFGARAPLMHRDEVIGMVVRTRAGRAPLFVSVGHKVSLETAVETVLLCAASQRSVMPEPTRVADALVRRTTRMLRASPPPA